MNFTISPNTKGVLHELLVGYVLNDCQHMGTLPGKNNSPEEEHCRLSYDIPKEAYDVVYARAKAAAEDIKTTILHHAPLDFVHWSSKPGDLFSITGIDASQKEDASDIVIKTTSGIYTGVSLKVTDKKAEVPVSNPGLNATYGGQVYLDQHRAKILESYTALNNGSRDYRKEYLQQNLEISKDIKCRNKETLDAIVNHTYLILSDMSKPDLVCHVRDHILHAHPTPMQLNGHNHVKHTTIGTSSFKFKHANPHHDYEYILTDSENISICKNGTSILFKYYDKPFARHRLKFESQSDPLGGIKGSGEVM